jgi:uncharacterized membrane protein YhaH (DUF805 family)
LALTVLAILIGATGATGGSDELYMLVLIPSFIFYLVLIPPSITATVRRFHDIDMSGWWVLGFLFLNMFPYLGVISVLVMLYFLIKKGTSGDNRFGSDPLGNSVRAIEPTTTNQYSSDRYKPAPTAFTPVDGLPVEKPPASKASGKGTSASVETKSDPYAKARKVIEYSDDAELSWGVIQGLPENYKNQFLEALSDDPKTDTAALAERLTTESDKEKRPFEDPELNDILDWCREISDEAASEFMEVYELLGDTIKPEELLAKFKAKFLSPEWIKQKKTDEWKAQQKASLAKEDQERARHRKILAEKLINGEMPPKEIQERYKAEFSQFYSSWIKQDYAYKFIPKASAWQKFLLSIDLID